MSKLQGNGEEETRDCNNKTDLALMKILVKQLYKKVTPKTGITTRFGSPVEILGPVPDWLWDGKAHEQVRVNIWSQLFGWKEQTVLKSSLVYKSKK